MTLPRAVFPGRYYLVTRRVTQRMFLLRPDDETNNAFIYCLAVAAEKYRIDVILTQMMSNHHHTVIYDRDGTIVEFTEHFHKLMARSQNALRGRWENMWSTEPTSHVELIDRSALIDKLVYTATNPVQHGLVDKVHHWPGVKAWGAFLADRALQAHRPRHFFRANGKMPATVTLRFTVPAELGARDELVQQVKERVNLAEAEFEQQRRTSGRAVLGRRGVLQQRWTDTPATSEPRRQLSPRVATRNTWARVEALQRNREFTKAYRVARLAWADGKPAVFPFGTYWLRRFANVTVGSPSTSYREMVERRTTSLLVPAGASRCR